MGEGLHFLDYWRVVRSRKEIVVAVTLLVLLTGAAFTLTRPKIYEANTRISVRKDVMDVDVFEKQSMWNYDPYFLRTQFEIIQSRPILYRVIEDLKLQELWGKTYGEDGQPLTRNSAYKLLKKNLEVEPYRDTSLIEIRMRSESPDEAALVANAVAEVYREERLNIKRRELKRGIEALQSEMDKQQAKVETAEAEVERIRSDLGISILGTGIQADKQRLAQLEADRMAARVDMLVRKARMDQLIHLEGDELLNSANYIVQDVAISSMRRQLIDTEVNLELMLQSYGENHPDVKQLLAATAKLNEKLLDSMAGLKKGLEADYGVAKAKFDALEELLNKAKEIDIAATGEKLLPFEKAQLDLSVQREIFNALRARVAQEGIEFEVPRTPVELVDPAEPPLGWVSPNLILNLVLSLIIGLSLGIGLAYFIEYLDTSVKTVDDVEKYLNLPVLGVIPQKVRPLVEEGPDSPHAEAYRVLRTNIIFKNKGLSGGAFAVVSGGVGEGKSTTLFNFAYVCAQLGDKVLIVDSDLRRPVQHSILGMSNRFGLTNVLMRDVPIEETIKPTSVPNLHFLPSGRIPRSALGLLDSQRMRELVKNLKARYDWVLFDSPPIVGISDASILASEVDGVLLVVQYRKYPRIISSRASQMVQNVGANLLGVVLNNINIMRDDYYYYYHSYYSHYYGAGESEEEQEQPAGVEATRESI